MAGRGGKRSTTWKPGEGPGKPVGTKHHKTKVKESLGLTNWAKFEDFVQNAGADKLVEEASKLTGKDFVYAYSTIAEYVKPKLQRTTLAGDVDSPLNLPAPQVIVYNTAPPLANKEEDVKQKDV